MKSLSAIWSFFVIGAAANTNLKILGLILALGLIISIIDRRINGSVDRPRNEEELTDLRNRIRQAEIDSYQREWGRR